MIEKLKEYKELIAIIVFFLGGFLWLHNQFPTKNDLIKEIAFLNCQLDKYITLTQLQIRGQTLAKNAQDLANRISGMETGIEDVALSPAMKFELEKLKSDFKYNREKYRKNQAGIENILDDLARSVCKGGKQ
jgi:hypothetical protein